MFGPDLLKKSAPSRIIFVSSATAFFWNNLSLKNLNYPKNHPMNFLRTSFIYGNSKLCNVIAANGFAERLKKFGVTSNSLHPGLVNTDIHARTARFLGIKTFRRMFRTIILFLYGKVRDEDFYVQIFFIFYLHDLLDVVFVFSSNKF